jgi:hypothetical protein
MKICTGIEFLNQCEYAVLCENGFGCKYQGKCDYQRPKLPTIGAIVDKLNGGKNLGWTDTDVEPIVKAIKELGNFA